MAIHQQVHEKFKVFVGGSIEEISSKVHDFTSGATVAAKSIGIEYLESKAQFVLTVGYRDDESGYAAELVSHSAGVLDTDSPDSISALEAALAAAAASSGNVICHELYVTEDGTANTVLLLHK